MRESTTFHKNEETYKAVEDRVDKKITWRRTKIQVLVKVRNSSALETKNNSILSLGTKCKP